MRRTFFYSTTKDLSAINLNQTASFDSMMKTTLINNTAPIYTVDNFKVKKLIFKISNIIVNILAYSLLFLLIYRLFLS